MRQSIGAQPKKAGAREWFALTILALPALMVAIDLFVILLAVPRMSEALHASSTQQLWILDMYGFMVAGFLITMGTLGDKIGRRKLLFVGAFLFGVASLLAAFSHNAGTMIFARALLGIGGAAISPSTLSLISVLFQDAKERAQAIGIWAASFAMGAIIGPLIGGLLLQHFWWGSVFLVGVPVMVLLLALGPFFLPEFKAPKAAHPEPVSVLFSLAAILPIIYGLKELARAGWHTVPGLAIVFGAIMSWLFIRRQKTHKNPLLDLKLFHSRNLSIIITALWLFSLLSGGAMVFVGQHLQFVEALTPLKAGLAMIPAMVASVIGFQIAPMLARRIRPAQLISGGLAITVTGLLVLAFSSATAGLLPLIVGLALASVGGAPLVTLGTNLVIGSAPLEKAGSAAAIAQTANESGLAFGVAFLGSILTFTYHTSITHRLPASLSSTQATQARDNVASALSVAGQLHNPINRAVTSAARTAFANGLDAVVIVGAIVLACMACAMAVMLREPNPS